MSTWVPIAVSGVAALGAIVAAVIAARSATRTKSAELQANRILDLEARLSSSRGKVFEPLVEAVGRLWDHISSDEPMDPDTFDRLAGQDIRRFTHWVQIYGSDDSVEVALQFMQASYHSPPPMVLVRLLGELLVAARRELGYPDTAISSLEVLGMRINDAYTNLDFYADLSDPIELVFSRHGWAPPWSISSNHEAKNLEGALIQTEGG
jgi:hypothetical protein